MVLGKVDPLYGINKMISYLIPQTSDGLSRYKKFKVNYYDVEWRKYFLLFFFWKYFLNKTHKENDWFCSINDITDTVNKWVTDWEKVSAAYLQQQSLKNEKLRCTRNSVVSQQEKNLATQQKNKQMYFLRKSSSE